MKFIVNIILLLYAFLISGCATFQIVDLNSKSSSIRSEEVNTNFIVGIDTLKIGGRYTDAEKWQQGLVEVLGKDPVFKKVAYPYRNEDNFDLIIRGEVSGDFREHGAKNFFTWWPGPFILAHNWRGTRYIYDAYADIEVIDVISGEVLGKYHAESSHELIHKSAAPGPFFAALIILPGVIKGAMTVSPNGNYRQKMYEVAYPELWQKISQQIIAAQSKRFLVMLDLQRKVCGEYLDEDPKIGQLWTEFETCQSQKYKLLGQETKESGAVSVYMSKDRSLRLHVDQKGRILQWFIPKRRKRIRSKIYQ